MNTFVRWFRRVFHTCIDDGFAFLKELFRDDAHDLRPDFGLLGRLDATGQGGRQGHVFAGKGHNGHGRRGLTNHVGRDARSVKELVTRSAEEIEREAIVVLLER